MEGEQWIRYARGAAAAYLAGCPPPQVAVHGLVLEPMEVALLQANAFYARWIGGSGQYVRRSTFAFGGPLFVTTALAATAVGNARRAKAARADAQPTWRRHQAGPVLVTDRRILCYTRESGWLSFFHGAVTEFYPDLPGWSVTYNYGGQCAPLRLSGPAAPALILWTGIGILGPRWSSDPRLTPLLPTP